ncbi:MAG: hypothetical protein U0821_18805 [Chloroflexota bacterium]
MSSLPRPAAAVQRYPVTGRVARHLVVVQGHGFEAAAALTTHRFAGEVRALHDSAERAAHAQLHGRLIGLRNLAREINQPRLAALAESALRDLRQVVQADDLEDGESARQDGLAAEAHGHARQVNAGCDALLTGRLEDSGSD